MRVARLQRGTACSICGWSRTDGEARAYLRCGEDRGELKNHAGNSRRIATGGVLRPARVKLLWQEGAGGPGEFREGDFPGGGQQIFEFGVGDGVPLHERPV